MKLKFKQRVAIKFISTKIRLINLLSTEKAAENIFKLFCTPYSGKPKREMPLLFKKGKNVQVSFEQNRINGWHFNSEINNGKKVLVIHGFDSCAFKSETIIQTLIDNHFEVFAFDALGHGTSDGKTINIIQYGQIIKNISDTYGKMFAFIAHSFGGLATSLVVEANKNIVDKLVLIAPATETEAALNNFFNFLKLPLHLQPEVEKVIIKVGQNPSSFFSVSRAIKQFETPTFWIHDEDDFICPIKDVLHVMDFKLSHVKFQITKKLGHNFIYRNKEVLHKVVEFLNS